jgi:LPS-assembly protein
MLSRGGIAAAIAALVLLCAPPAGAQEAISRDLPVLLTADEVTYNEDLGVVVASGNVEISQGDRVLQAKTVTYNQKTNTVTASGNVSLLEPKGDVVFAEYVELTDDMKYGVIKGIGILLQDKSRMAAAGGRLVDTKRELANAVYSPCELCPKDPTRAPLWQVKAVRVVHDTEAQDIIYHDAWMEMYGIPVAYTPYLSHPDPTVKRRSGFLAPAFGSDSQLGFFSRAPYYIVLDESRDVTIEPMVTTKERGAIFGEYRQRMGRGTLESSGSFTRVHNRDNDGNELPGDRSRGHFFTKARYDLDPTWRTGFDGGYVSDDTYLRRYRISSQNVVTTRPFIEGFRGNNYAIAQGYYFRGLRQIDDEDTTPLVAPLMDYNFVGDTDRLGGRWFGDANLMSLQRQQGADSRRIATRIGWERPYTTTRGDVWTTSFTWHNDLYYVNDVTPFGGPRTAREEGATGRSLPIARLDWRYPFVRESGGFRQVIEPVVALLAAPNGGNPGKIPNEDSTDFEFDDTNLFSTNRFAGLDRVEGGSRAIYGMRFSAYGNKAGQSELFLGQSYRARDDDTFEEGSGLNKHLSDYVGRLRVAPADYLDGIYRFRYAQTNFAPVRHELIASVGPPALRLQTGYLFFKQTAATSEFGDREQIALGVTSRITRQWSARFGHTRNLSGRDEGPLATGAGLTYEDECFIFDAGLSRSYTRDRDYRPSDTVLFRFMFKTLGEVRTSAR